MNVIRVTIKLYSKKDESVEFTVQLLIRNQETQLYGNIYLRIYRASLSTTYIVC